MRTVASAADEARAARTQREPPACDVTIVAHDIGSVRGGMERQISDLVVGLCRRGHRVTVIARTCELPAGTGAEFRRVPGPGRPFLIAYPWFLLAGSLAVRRHRRGVVQVTGAIVLNRVDVVAVHYCQQVAPATPSRSTRLFRMHVRLSRVLKRLGERLCFRISHAATFVCVSEGVAAEVREHYPRLAVRVVTIYNGIETGTFAPGVRREQARELRAALDIGERQLVLAFVGGDWQRKGLAAVLRAVALSPQWLLVVAGSGDEQRYRELADSLSIGDAVRWLGARRDVQHVYDIADAFVTASSYETFSLVTFEAAASGLAILATPVSGVTELIVDGENGFLVSDSPEAIAERLAALAGDPELRSRLGAAARRAALAFSRERMVAEHHRLYMRLAAGQA